MSDYKTCAKLVPVE